jgi:hypothetical protein
MSAYQENTSIFKNKIINGDFRIDQRLGGVAQVYGASSNLYVADRFKFGMFGSGYSASSATTQRISTDYPPGASNSLKVSTTIGMTIAVSDARLGGFLAYAVEGLDMNTWDWGKATAKKVTLSFWVKANKTGTLSVELENSGTTMTYSTTVTILVANTWEKKTITIAGPTSGTWLTDTGIGLQINIGLFTNQNWLYGAVTGSWNANRYIFNTAQTNFLSTAGDAVYFGNFQLEMGDTATDFESRPYQVELALCQRYFLEVYGSSDIYGQRCKLMFSTAAGGNAYFFVNFPVEMRVGVLPTMAGTIGLNHPGAGSASVPGTTAHTATGIGTKGFYGYWASAGVTYSSWAGSIGSSGFLFNGSGANYIWFNADF